jgi:hypothetical protein
MALLFTLCRRSDNLVVVVKQIAFQVLTSKKITQAEM